MADSEIRQIAAGRLRVDPTIQRGLNRNRVNREVERFNPDGLGVLTVSDRGKNDLVIVDGQHRTQFAISSEGESYLLTCEVFTGLTLRQEAALFLIRNNMVVPKAMEQFHVRVTENDPVAVYLKTIVERHGWKLGPGAMNTHFNAVKALERVYLLDRESDPTAAERAVATLAGAWGHADGAMDGRLVEGLGRLYARHKEAIDTGYLAEKLAKGDRDPISFVGAARTLRNLRKGSVVDAVAELMTREYNQYRKPRTQLPAWRA